MELQLVSAASLDVSSGLSRRYVFKRGEWIHVDNEDDWGWLMAASPALLRERTSLADRHLRYVGAKPVSLDIYSRDNKPFPFRFQPGRAYRFDDVNGRMLARAAGGNFEVLKVQEWVEAAGEGTLLIVRGGGLGDLLLLTPALREIKQLYPTVRLHVACSATNLRVLQHNPYLDGVSTRSGAYDLAPYDFLVDLEAYVERHADSATTKRSLLFAQGLGLSALPDERLDYTVETCDRTWATQVLRPLRKGRRPVIAVQAHGSNPSRHPAVTNTQAVIAAMRKQGWSVVVLGGWAPQDGWGADLDLSGETNVAQAGGVIAVADAFFGMDSGLTHLANAIGKPVVALYGPVDSMLRVAGQPHCQTLTEWQKFCDTPCDDTRLARCREGPKCLNAIRTVDIIAALERALSGDH
jgi:ADP-heptose:LPS heptosyltransferase